MGPVICKKALILNEKLRGNPHFKAKTGWLQKFKMSHNIHQVDISGKNLSSNFGSADHFKKQFLFIIKEKGYGTENIYNADETRLNWKLLPQKTLVLRNEKSVSRFKVNKECITVMMYANASGSNR